MKTMGCSSVVEHLQAGLVEVASRLYAAPLPRWRQEDGKVRDRTDVTVNKIGLILVWVQIPPAPPI